MWTHVWLSMPLLVLLLICKRKASSTEPDNWSYTFKIWSMKKQMRREQSPDSNSDSNFLVSCHYDFNFYILSPDPGAFQISGWQSSYAIILRHMISQNWPTLVFACKCCADCIFYTITSTPIAVIMPHSTWFIYTSNNSAVRALMNRHTDRCRRDRFHTLHCWHESKLPTLWDSWLAPGPDFLKFSPGVSYISFELGVNLPRAGPGADFRVFYAIIE